MIYSKYKYEHMELSDELKESQGTLRYRFNISHVGIGLILMLIFIAGLIWVNKQLGSGFDRSESSLSIPISLAPSIIPTSVSNIIEIDPTKADEPYYWQGEISPRVPYQGLKFQEIEIHNFRALNGSLDESDFQFENSVFDGFTFVANEGEDFEFVAYEDKNSNPGSFINTELYGWGPTVIKMDTRIGWGVPATTRYFYVIKGTDYYGQNYSVPGVTPFNGSKYGRYTLEITQRK